jgi:RNA polymerase sigma-70 factor (ECF subfamily)
MRKRVLWISSRVRRFAAIASSCLDAPRWAAPPRIGYVWRVATTRYAEEIELVRALRVGEAAAFEQLVDMFGRSMQRVASLYVRDRAAAEEVVQDAWIGVLRGIDRFEGRSSLRTWIFRILVNTAKTRGARESRTVPFAALSDDPDADQPSVPEDRFLGHGTAWPGHWASGPAHWDVPLERLLSREARDVITRAIAQLPEMQQRVVTLRDVEGWSSEDVCNVLELSETNQRVLLHRARSRLRQAIDRSAIEGTD